MCVRLVIDKKPCSEHLLSHTQELASKTFQLFPKQAQARRAHIGKFQYQVELCDAKQKRRRAKSIFYVMLNVLYRFEHHLRLCRMHEAELNCKTNHVPYRKRTKASSLQGARESE